MKFCPTCKSLMIPDSKNGQFLCRKCEKPQDLNRDDKDLHKKIRVAEAKSREMAVFEERAVTLPRTNVECSKCGHNEAFWVLRQTRAADEPETKIYRCVKCEHSWREY